jgi:hypothetical protein
LTLSKSLSAYDPAGDPGAMPRGVLPAVALCASAVAAMKRRKRPTVRAWQTGADKLANVE